MQPTQTTPNPPSPIVQFYTLWGALFASQGMIVFVSQTVMTAGPTADPGFTAAPASALEAAGIPPFVFALIAVAFAAAAYFIPRFLMREARKRHSANASVNPNTQLREIAQSVLPAWILRWALLEAITMMGFVSSTLYAKPTMIFPFAGAALVGFLMTVPTEERIRASLKS